MEELKIDEIVQQTEETNEGEAASADREKVPVEKIKKLQLVLMVKEFIFYSAVFNMLDHCFTDRKMKMESDLERCAIGNGRIGLWARIYNCEKKTFFGKDSGQWFDIAMWIGFIVSVSASVALVTYLLILNKSNPCPTG